MITQGQGGVPPGDRGRRGMDLCSLPAHFCTELDFDQCLSLCSPPSNPRNIVVSDDWSPKLNNQADVILTGNWGK